MAPSRTQYANGVVDIRVQDDAAAVQAAKRYLSYFQGSRPPEKPAEAERLKTYIPPTESASRRSCSLRRMRVARLVLCGLH